MDVEAVIDLLLTIGYVDGLLHEDEKQFIAQYLERVIEHVAASEDERSRLRTRVDAAYARLDKEIGALAAEVTAAGDNKFMKNRLKVRAVARFRGFPPADQKVALDLFEHVMRTDGSISDQERELHEELRAYFHASRSLPEAATPEPPPDMLAIEPASELPLAVMGHPLLDAIELPYARVFQGRVGFGGSGIDVLRLAIRKIGPHAGERIGVYHVDRRHGAAKGLGQPGRLGHGQHRGVGTHRLEPECA